MDQTTFHIRTFGCQMNVYDSDWLARALTERGLSQAGPDEAQVWLVNTCSVREKPEQKVYSELGRLREMWERDPSFLAGVGGCVAQQVGAGFFQRFPWVRLVFGTDGTASVPAAVERLLREPGLRLDLTDFSEHYLERETALPEPGSEIQAFVTIMQGCDNFCAYCIVPHVRGRQKSRSSRAVLDECRALVERGAREITLLGQNVNSYGLDAGGDGTSFAGLLGQVADIPGLARLRFTTSHPKDLSAEVVRAFGELPQLCPQLHLPLQAGSDRVLGAMGRRYDMARYLGLVDALRAARPDMTLTTDLIVGFPGETEDDFQATLDAVERVGYDAAFSFCYNDRPGTRAERMEPKVEAAVKSERLERLQALLDRLTGKALGNMVGAEVEVLLEGPSRKQDRSAVSWRGRDPWGRVVNVDCAHAPGNRGELITARITEAKRHTLYGIRVGAT